MVSVGSGLGTKLEETGACRTARAFIMFKQRPDMGGLLSDVESVVAGIVCVVEIGIDVIDSGVVEDVVVI